MTRYIGIVPRVKMTKDQEARPTLVCIRDGVKDSIIKLETEQDELDFTLGCLPTGYRDVSVGEDISQVKSHHLLKDDPEEAAKKKRELRLDQVPKGYIGFKAGDVVAMALGGCGDNFAFALSRMSEKLGAGTKVMRIPPFILEDARGTDSKDQDHILLVNLAVTKPELFYDVILRDRKTIKIRECLRVRTDTMKARMACEQRLHQRFIGKIFCSEAGLYPEGSMEKTYAETRASDVIFKALLDEEKRAESELEKAVKESEVYQKVFGQVDGAGPKIAARIIATVGDIRRFETASRLKGYLGVHVLMDGRFPRRRNSEVANWSGEARQALYLLGEQFNRRPDSEWGKYLRTCKARLREKHPEKILVDGKSRYSDGHIHKMGTWRCMSRFVEWLFTAWWQLEKSGKQTETKVTNVAA